MNGWSCCAAAHPGDGWDRMGGAWPGWMLGWSLLLLLLIVAGAALAFTVITRTSHRPPRPDQAPRPDRRERGREILAERYARGEIDTAEYRERSAVLGDRAPDEPG